MRDLIEKMTAADEQPQPPPPEPAPQREFGHVIFFHPDPDKNFGFIRSETLIGADLFFRLSHVQDRQPLRTAQRVSFVISVDHRGRPRATDVKVEAD